MKKILLTGLCGFGLVLAFTFVVNGNIVTYGSTGLIDVML